MSNVAPAGRKSSCVEQRMHPSHRDSKTKGAIAEDCAWLYRASDDCLPAKAAITRMRSDTAMSKPASAPLFGVLAEFESPADQDDPNSDSRIAICWGLLFRPFGSRSTAHQ